MGISFSMASLISSLKIPSAPGDFRFVNWSVQLLKVACPSDQFHLNHSSHKCYHDRLCMMP